jgi:cation transport protein ChaC
MSIINSNIQRQPEEFSWLTKDERALRLQKLLNIRPIGPLWVFAFGSLMWNPCFEYDRCEEATFEGWERKFNIWSTVSRGTMEQPGLGLCLEKGRGTCKGLAYRLLPDNEVVDWPTIWNREMNTGVYNAIWADLNLHTGERVKALTFVVDSTHTQYAGQMSIPLMAEIIVDATGSYGRCRDYLASTVKGMAKLGIFDVFLDELLLAVDKQKEHGTD